MFCFLFLPVLPRYYPAFGLHSHLLSAVSMLVHVVGLPPSHQPPGIQRPLRDAELLRVRPHALLVLVPEHAGPGPLPAALAVGQVPPLAADTCWTTHHAASRFFPPQALWAEGHRQTRELLLALRAPAQRQLRLARLRQSGNTLPPLRHLGGCPQDRKPWSATPGSPREALVWVGRGGAFGHRRRVCVSGAEAGGGGSGAGRHPGAEGVEQALPKPRR